MTDTIEDAPNYPASHSFREVNEFVHDVGVSFEDLQALCLGLAAELESTNPEVILQALRYYAEQAKYGASWKVDDAFHVMEDKGRVAKNALKSYSKGVDQCQK